MAKVIRVVSEEPGEFFQHRPVITTIVTAHARGKDNALAVGLHGLISKNPPVCGVAIMPKRFSYQLITESKEFGVNFLPFEQVKLVASVGTSSGRNIDKFQKFNIVKDKSVKTAVPILKDAYVAYECKLVDDRSYGDFRWLVGEIVAVHWLEGVFTPEDTLDLDRVSPILFLGRVLGRDFYLTTSKDSVRSVGRIVH